MTPVRLPGAVADWVDEPSVRFYATRCAIDIFRAAHRGDYFALEAALAWQGRLETAVL